jgi:C4-dicarboxylate-specific signal transduction histidine kinase
MYTDRRRAIDLIAELQSVATVLSPLLTSGGVRMLIDTGDETLLRAEIRPEHLQRALSVLIASLVEGLRHVRQPEIRLSLRGHTESCEILICDNGPGIVGTTGQAMLAALSGHRLVGREGIGLAAAKSILTTNGGTVDIVHDHRRRGTTIRILVPRKRSRATTPVGR